MSAPTPRQLEVLAAVHTSVQSRGYPPTLRELGRLLGMSTTRGPGEHVKALVAKGLLASTGHRSRALRVTQAGLRAIGVEARPRVVPVTTERRCPCGAAFFGDGCPVCR